jgi:hypothetical protein
VPFFNAAVRLPVGPPLDRTLFKKFLKTRFQEGKRSISDGQSLAEKDIAAAWEVLFSMQKDAYELILTTLSPQQTKVLRALAHSDGAATLSSSFISSTGITLAPSVRKAMTKLVDRRLVQKINTPYRFCDPFLAVWLRSLPM